jgi:hypothetical protein
MGLALDSVLITLRVPSGWILSPTGVKFALDAAAVFWWFSDNIVVDSSFMMVGSFPFVVMVLWLLFANAMRRVIIDSRIEIVIAITTPLIMAPELFLVTAFDEELSGMVNVDETFALENGTTLGSGVWILATENRVSLW